MRYSPSIVPGADEARSPGTYAFNAVKGWFRDVSEEIANELADLIDIDGRDIPPWLGVFIEEHAGSRPIQLPLPLPGP
jgi:hypothetical protein